MGRWSRGAGLLAVGLAVFAEIHAAAADVTPLPRAHAHNDYRHARPLQDALDHGFCSVEADIFLVGGELLVGHDRSELRPGRTLERLYLAPLRERVRAHDGHVFGEDAPFRLLVDIKSSGTETYRALDRVLQSYGDILAHVEQGHAQPGPILVVVSGNRDKSTITADKTRFAGIDGRLTDLGSDSPSHLLPWISDRWTAHFTWDGTGTMPAAERRKLRRIVEQAHREGRAVRFWATPETDAMWAALTESGVDLINTDDLAGLRDFFLEHRRNSKD